MSEVIFCDLDGTLLNVDGQPDLRTVKKIKAFINNGGIFIIATGRLDHDIIYIEKKLGIRSYFRISQNGAIIKNQYNDIVLKRSLDTTVAKKIVNLLKKKKLRVEISDVNHRYLPSPRGVKNNGEFIDKCIIDPYFNRKIGESIHPTSLLTFGTENKFLKLTEYVNTNYGEKIETIKTSANTLEFLSKDTSKGAAIKKILKNLSPKPESICAIGDSENDLSMFEVADYTYSLLSASETIQNNVDNVFPTVGDCIEDFINTI